MTNETWSGTTFSLSVPSSLHHHREQMHNGWQCWAAHGTQNSYTCTEHLEQRQNNATCITLQRSVKECNTNSIWQGGRTSSISRYWISLWRSEGRRVEKTTAGLQVLHWFMLIISVLCTVSYSTFPQLTQCLKVETIIHWPGRSLHQVSSRLLHPGAMQAVFHVCDSWCTYTGPCTILSHGWPSV
jgi:hypothetical protein